MFPKLTGVKTLSPVGGATKDSVTSSCAPAANVEPGGLTDTAAVLELKVQLTGPSPSFSRWTTCGEAASGPGQGMAKNAVLVESVKCPSPVSGLPMSPASPPAPALV